jgi:sec-independent protein translocase protein TatC
MADVELPLTGHLAELRKRLARALVAVAIAFAATYPNSAFLFQVLQAPLRESAAASNLHFQVIGTGIAEAFFTRLGVSFIGAVFLALPVILYQLWRFVVPGLESNEARYAKWFVLFGTLFFLAGASFCYTMVFPVGFPFFLQEYADIGIDPQLRISEYLSFTSRMMLAFGVTFEMPVVIFFLARGARHLETASQVLALRGALHLHRRSRAHADAGRGVPAHDGGAAHGALRALDRCRVGLRA